MTQAPDRPIHLAAPMLNYRCNEKGCCCQSWGIPFKPSDLARLAAGLPPEERNRVGRELELVVDPDEGIVTTVRLRREGPERRCIFLEKEGGCEVHRRFGTKPLPDLCVTFPVVAYDAGDRIEYHFEALCPSVLDELANPQTPYHEVSLDPKDHPGLAERARNLSGYPKTLLGETPLDQTQMRLLRDRALASLTDTGRPAVEHLCALSYAFDRLRADRDIEAFEVHYNDDPQPFFAFLEHCANTHNSRVLASLWRSYKHFVHDFDTEDSRLENFEQHIEHWAKPMLTWMVPQEPALRPLMVRYLSHRYHSLFTRVQGDIKLSFGSAPQVYALSIRFAAALSGALERPTDLGIAKASLGFADYVYRNIHLPEASLPWFTPLSEPNQPWQIPLPPEDQA